VTEASPTLPRISRDAIHRLLHPRSIAVVGASDSPGSIGGAPISLIERFGYVGDVHYVSRTRTEINGRPCVDSIEGLPYGVDAVILAIPKEGVAEAILAAGRQGVGGAIVFSSGYAEAGTNGAAQQFELASVATEYDIALAGPNCLGLINFTESVPLTFGDASPNRRAGGPSLAIISQSGAMSLALTYAAMAQDIAVSYTISTGNEAVLGIEDYLGAILGEDGLRAVALLIEQIRRPAEFIELARVARQRGVALCVLHTGRGARAQAASLSHTGAIAGDQEVMRTILGREGVLFIDSLDELIDTACVLVKCPMPSAYGVAFMTDSGAAKTYAIDVSDDIGLLLPELTPPTLVKLTDELPAFAIASNPVDITAMGLNDPSLYARVASALLGDDEVGLLVVSSMPGSVVQGTQQVEALVPALVTARKPVIYTIMGGETPLPPENKLKILDAGLCLFRSPERALRAARNVTRLARTLRDGESRVAPGPFGALPLDSRNKEYVSEHEAKVLLSRAGLRVPSGELTTDVRSARAAASRLGYPVVLKVVSAQILHKSDVGGVRLGIRSDTELAAAYHDVAGRLGRRVLISALAPVGIEMAFGLVQDADFGTFVMAAFGGTWIEHLKDRALAMAPLDESTAERLLSELRLAKVLDGVRGAAPCDRAALVRTFVQLGELARDLGAQIAEMDLNPVLVSAAGAIAVDCLIIPRRASCERRS